MKDRLRILNHLKLSGGLLLLILVLSGITSFGQGTTLKVQVLEFNLVDSVSFPKTLLPISTELGTSLNRDKSIDIISSTGDGQSALTDEQKDSLYNGQSIAVVPDVDFVVFGNYILENRFFRIYPMIYEVKHKHFIPLSVLRGEVEDMEGLMQRVNTNVLEKLTEVSPVMRLSFNRIVFNSNYRQEERNIKLRNELTQQSDLYTRQVIDFIEYDGIEYAEIIPWSQIVKYGPGEKTIRDSLKPDLIITLTFVFDSITPVQLKTDFKLFENNHNNVEEFQLPDLDATHYPDTGNNFLLLVQQEMFQFLNQIIDDYGRIDKGPFVRLKSAGPTDKLYIDRAEKLVQKRDFYLSSLCYYYVLNNDDNSGDNTDIHLQLGFNKVYMFRIFEAGLEFDLVLKDDPKNPEAFVGKSLISYFNTDFGETINHDEAKRLLNKAKENGLNNDLIYEGLMGYYNFEEDNFQEALNHFNKAWQADRTDVNFRIGERLSIETLKINLGLCYIGLEQFDQAISWYKGLKDDFSRSGNRDIPYYLGIAYSNRGIDHFYNKEYETALKDFKAAQLEFPDSDINDFIRLSLMHLSDFEQANAFIQKEIDNGNYDASYVWKRHGADIKSAMVEKAGTSNVYDEKMVSEIIGCLEKSLASYASDPVAFYQLGEIYLLIQDNPKALDYMKKAAEADPSDYEIKLGLMQAYLINNEYGACEDVYRDMSSRKNRKYFEARTNILMEFLNASAVLCQDKNAKKEFKRIDKEFERVEKEFNETVVIYSWNFSPYADWLKNSSLEGDAKKSLEDLLAELKATQNS